MSFTAKLVCGNRSLSLLGNALTLSGGWQIAEGGVAFSPPKGTVIYGSTGAWGATRTGSYAENNELTLTLRYPNSTVTPQGWGAFQRAVHDLVSFFEYAKLHQEQGARDAVYLVRDMQLSTSGTVLFGRGPLYYEIMAGALDTPSAYAIYLNSAAPVLLTATVTLATLPYPVSKPVLAAEGGGWLQFDDDGRVALWEGRVNSFLNPVFGHATPGTDWAVEDADLTATVDRVTALQLRDLLVFQSMQLINKHATDAHTYTSTKNLVGGTYALSGYVRTDGSAVTSSDLQLYGQGAVLTTTFTAVADHPGWYRMTATYVAGGSSTHGVTVKAGKRVNISHMQLESCAFGLGSELMVNGGFETAGGGGADVFGTWTETAGDGNIIRTTTAGQFYAETAAAKLVAGATSNTNILQAIAVTPGQYYFYFYTRGDGTYDGRYQIYDVDHAADLVATTATGVTGATYAVVRRLFTVPAGCATVNIVLWCPTTNAGTAYFDAVSLATITLVPGMVASPVAVGGQGMGLAWSGTAHNSATTRTVASLNIPTYLTAHPGFECLRFQGGALSVWLNTAWAGNDGVLHSILDMQVAADTNRILLSKTAANDLTFTIWGSTAAGYKLIALALTGANWPANTDIHLMVTWNTTGPLKMYLNGVDVGTPASGGTWTPMTSLAVLTGLGASLNGWLADVRIWDTDFAFDAGKQASDVYAEGRGQSELPFIQTTSGSGSIYNTDDTTYSNRFVVGNLAGDVDAGIRLLFDNNSSQNQRRMYFGLKRLEYPGQYLNVHEGAAGTDCTDTATGGRSGGYMMRVAPAATTEPAAYNVRYTVIADGRTAPYLSGYYRLVLVAHDGAAALNTFKVKAKVTMANGAWVGQTGAWVYADNVTTYSPIDLGCFFLPPLPPAAQFDVATPVRVSGDSTTYCSVDLFVWLTATSGVNFDVDCLVMFPADNGGMINDTDNAWVDGGVICFDTIARPARSYLCVAATGAPPYNLSWEPYRRAELIGEFPQHLPPHAWVFGNALGQRDGGACTPADSKYIVMVVQHRYLWSR